MDSEEKRKIKNESETLIKLCGNRKKQNFDSLKQWDQVRAHKLITHRKVADQIDDALQSRIAQSVQFLRVVLQFFSDCYNQQVIQTEMQKKIQAQSITNPESKLMSNSVSRNINITTSKCLMRLYNTTLNLKSVKRMLALLDEAIQKIETMLTESERDIMEIRTKIQLKAVQIQNQNGLTIQKCDQVVASYNHDKTATKLFHAQSDLFYLQHEFLQQSVAQTKTQQQFGQSVVELLECVQKYQKAKLELVKESLQNYLVALQQTQQDNQNVRSLLDILEKKTQDEIIHVFYSSEEFVSKQIMKDIRKAEEKGENQKMDLQTIKNFLTKIEYHPFDCRNLVLKQYRTYLKLGEQLENSYLIVTVDAFLHIYKYKDQFELHQAIPQYSLKCNSSLDMKREGEINLNIQIKKKLIILNKDLTNKIRVVFLSEDQRQQFLEFVAKITI